jgi:hypothetical protein
MKTFKHHITEAKKPNPRANEAERLRMEAIKAYKDALLKHPNLSKITKNRFKWEIENLGEIDYTSEMYSRGSLSVAIDYLKEIPAKIKENLKRDVQHRKEEEKQKKILENPYTICDLLSDPSPKRFIDLIRNGLVYMDRYPKWMKDLAEIQDAMELWFDTQGGTRGDKAGIVKKFEKMVSCTNRAPWAAWSGKAWRGVGRGTAVVRNYQFTGEVKKIGKHEWLVAKGTYKSHYGAQSWSDEWKTAESFAGSDLSGEDKRLAFVVYEINLNRNESLLSPDVIKKISKYGTGAQREREVIRVGNNSIPVTIYVKAESIRWMVGVGKPKDMIVKMIGMKGAEAFTKTRYFKAGAVA